LVNISINTALTRPTVSFGRARPASGNQENDIESPIVLQNPDLKCQEIQQGSWKRSDRSASRLQNFADSSNPSASAPSIYNPQFLMEVKGSNSGSGFVLVTVRCLQKSVAQDATLHVFVYSQQNEDSRSNTLQSKDRRRTFPGSALVASQDGFVSGSSVTVAAKVGTDGGKFIICCCLQSNDDNAEVDEQQQYEYAPVLKQGKFEIQVSSEEENSITVSEQLPSLNICKVSDETDTDNCDKIISNLKASKFQNPGSGPIEKLDWDFVTLKEDPTKAILKKLSNGTKFIDQDFLPNEKSVNKDSNDTQLHYKSWVRLSELTDSPAVFKEGIDADDVLQGSLGNCWFMGAIASIAWARPKLIRNSFSKLLTGKRMKECFEKGIFSIQIFCLKSQQYRWIVVDDYIPVDENLRRVFSTGRDANEIWVIILEKVFAKLHGSYQSMAGHSKYCLKIGPAMRCLTHAYVERVEPPKMNASALWERLLQAKADRSIMECSTRNHPETQNKGLVCYHAYSVVGIAALNDGTKLLKIRNTWGHGEWTGKWSDDDDRWTDQVKRQVDHFVDSDDGSFHMELQDFAIHYNRLYFATLENEPEEEQKYALTTKGYWLTPFAGGLTTSNPQYAVKFDKGTDTKQIQLRLKIPHSQFSQDYGQHRLVLLVCEIGTKKSGAIERVHHLNNIIKQSQEGSTASRQVDLNLRLPAYCKGIVVIPCWDDGTKGNKETDTGSFKITVESSAKFKMVVLTSLPKGASRSIDQDLGRLSLVPSELTSSANSFTELTEIVSEKVKESCNIQ